MDIGIVFAPAYSRFRKGQHNRITVLIVKVAAAVYQPNIQHPAGRIRYRVQRAMESACRVKVEASVAFRV